MTPVILGVLIAIVALAFVLRPLIVPPKARARSASKPASSSGPQDSAVRALREIEFDRVTGKLGDDDYERLKAEYTGRAVRELRAAPAAAGAPGAAPAGGDDAESFIAAARSALRECRHCGAASPEPDAVYCSTCGTFLAGACTRCGRSVTEPGAHFCPGCGWELAA